MWHTLLWHLEMGASAARVGGEVTLKDLHHRQKRVNPFLVSEHRRIQGVGMLLEEEEKG